MKKVLFVTTRLIYPTNDGRKVVLYNYCKGLSDKFNCEVRLFSLIKDDEMINEQPNFISKVYKASQPSKIEKVTNLLFKSIIQRKWPLQVSLYFSKKSKSKLDKILEDYNPDIVIADMARTAEYLKDLDESKYIKILDMDDLLSKRYEAQSSQENLGVNAIGAYSKNLPNIINKILNNKRLIKYVLELEAKILGEYEKSIANYYKSIILVSPIETNKFNKVLGENKCIDITIGVNYEYLSENVYIDKKDNYIAFLGNMYVAHNKDAVRYFLENIFSNILEKNPSCVFRIIGRCPEEYKLEMSKKANIEVTGEVDDIRKYVQECSVAVAPLVYGTGIKTKILETMAMGIPIVTNDIGIEGINISDNLKSLIVKNDKFDFANSVLEIIDNKDVREYISKEQLEFVFQHHRWDNILNKFSYII